jgi:hypothetical protein
MRAWREMKRLSVTPAKAGVHAPPQRIPAFAGVTE